MTDAAPRSAIQVRRVPEEEAREEGVFEWPIWEKDVSTFAWHYDERETCYVIAGQVRVEPSEGEPVSIGPGDMVVFPAGLDCNWTITEPVRKHYSLG